MTTAYAVWPFGADADPDDPLSAVRIAVTGSHPAEAYLVAFDRSSQARPTTTETAVLASYLEYYKHVLYFGDAEVLARLRQLPLDVDPFTNPVVFHKFGYHDWGFRRHSPRRYSTGRVRRGDTPFLAQRRTGAAAEQPRRFSLVDLLDDIEDPIAGTPSRAWQQWKSDHPQIFAISTATPAAP